MAQSPYLSRDWEQSDNPAKCWPTLSSSRSTQRGCMVVITSFVSFAASLETYAAPTRKTCGHAARNSGRWLLQTYVALYHETICMPAIYLSTAGMF